MTEPIQTAPKRHMSTRQRLLFFLVAWLIVLMPFLFWWNTWFGRNLSDKDLNTYLHDEAKPRHIQPALVQLGERMSRHDATAARWYPEVVRLATHPVEEVRKIKSLERINDMPAAAFWKKWDADKVKAK